MKNSLRFFIFISTLIFSILFTISSFAQSEIKSNITPPEKRIENPKVNILNHNYYLYSGEIIEQTYDSLYLKGGSTIYAFHKDEIVAIGDQYDYFREERKKDRDFEDKMLLTASDGFLKKNEVEANIYMLLLGELKYGISDKWNIGAGMSFLPSEGPDSTSTFELNKQLFILSQKIQLYKKENFSFFYKGTFVKFPSYVDSTSGQKIKFPWQSFHTLGASFTSKQFKLILSVTQPYFRDIRRWKAFNVTGVNSLSNFVLSQSPRVEYYFSVSSAFNVSRKFSFTLENVFYAAAWNTFGNYSTPKRRVGFIPMPGVRMYTGNYTYGLALAVFRTRDQAGPPIGIFPWAEASYLF